MSLSDHAAMWAKASAGQVLDALGIRVQHLTALTDADDGYCLIGSTFPAGMVVPVHSHADRETFYILDGELRGLQGDHWVTLVAGDVFDVPGNTTHGFRNLSGVPVPLLLVTTMRMGRFFREIGRPAATGPPNEADLERFFAIAQKYGHWLGGPEDNAAVGITFG